MKTNDREEKWELFKEDLFCDYHPSHVNMKTVKSFVKITYFGLINKVSRLELEVEEHVKTIEEHVKTIEKQARRIEKLENLAHWSKS